MPYSDDKAHGVTFWLAVSIATVFLPLAAMAALLSLVTWV